MMTREMIINELTNRGYNAVAQDNTKNGVVLEESLKKQRRTASMPQ